MFVAVDVPASFLSSRYDGQFMIRSSLRTFALKGDSSLIAPTFEIISNLRQRFEGNKSVLNYPVIKNKQVPKAAMLIRTMKYI